MTSLYPFNYDVANLFTITSLTFLLLRQYPVYCDITYLFTATLRTWVQTVRFHPNGNYVATGSMDKSCRLWDLQSGECVRVFEVFHRLFLSSPLLSSPLLSSPLLSSPLLSSPLLSSPLLSSPLLSSLLLSSPLLLVLFCLILQSLFLRLYYKSLTRLCTTTNPSTVTSLTYTIPSLSTYDVTIHSTMTSLSPFSN